MTRPGRLVQPARTIWAIAWAIACAIAGAGCQGTLGLAARLGEPLGRLPDRPVDRPAARPVDRSAVVEQRAALPEASRPSAALGQGGENPAGLLAQAAASYERGDDDQAIGHLETYVAERSEHLIARAQLAELLFRQKRHNESRLHFELFIAQAQDHGDLAFRYLVHSHSRLVEIAEEQEDEYEERLNRGIGLYLLACRRTQESDAGEAPWPDALFCKAAAQLQEARRAEPLEARPDWYLYQVWSRLGQQAGARRALAAADAHALLSRLTPAERRQLHAACLGERPLR